MLRRITEEAIKAKKAKKEKAVNGRYAKLLESIRHVLIKAAKEGKSNYKLNYLINNDIECKLRRDLKDLGVSIGIHEIWVFSLNPAPRLPQYGTMFYW